MKRYFLIFLCFVLFVPIAFGQNTQPTPGPTPSVIDDSDEIVKISTNLIQFDVSVTDKDGKVVTDLKPEDFEIYENGVKQDITNFSFIPTVQQTNVSAPVRKKDKDKENIDNVPIPVGQLRPEQVKRAIALVVDDLGLSFESVDFVRRTLRKFVDEQMQPNDLVAIVRTSVGSGSLQQFTSNREQLYAAIERIRWNARGRGGVAAFSPLAPSQTEEIIAQGPPANVDGSPGQFSESELRQLEENVAQEKESREFYDLFRGDIFTAGTLGAINYVVNGMGGLPGRKSIMLFSDGFSVCSQLKPERCKRIIDSLRRLTDITNRASVSIYSFDARGLAATSLNADDKTIGQSIGSPYTFSDKVRETIQQTIGDRSRELFDKQGGLAYLANETGGRSFFNSNDMNDDLDKALADQKGYYLLGYEPDSETFDPSKLRYNKIQIKVIRKDVNVRYRSGFFGVEDKDIQQSNLSAQQEIYKALTAPFPAEGIKVRFNSLFGTEPKTGNFVRSLIHITVKDLKFFDEPNGEKKAVIDVLAVNFGDKGTPVETISKNVVLTVKKELYEKILNEGFVYTITFPVKNPGGYQFGVAVRDASTGKVGSANQFIEVPKLKKGRLVLSGIILDNFTAQQWRQISQTSQPLEDKSNPLVDTSVRRFNRGTILEYGVEIYNAKFPKNEQPQLITQLRLYQNGKLILKSSQLPIKLSEQDGTKQVTSMGAIKLGVGMASGDYILQIIVVDNLAKGDNKIATQWVQFQIID